jgi:hypothetical protein
VIAADVRGHLESNARTNGHNFTAASLAVSCVVFGGKFLSIARASRKRSADMCIVGSVVIK